MFLLSYIRKARRVTTLYRLTGSGITLRKIKRIMLHATYTDRYSAYIRRKQLLPPFDEIFQISLVRSCVKVRLLVFGFLSKNAAKILLFFDIRKREGDFVLFLSLGHLSLFSRSSLGHRSVMGGNRGFKRFINSGFFLQCSQKTIQNGKENQYFTSALMYELEPVLAETIARKKLEQDHHGTMSREEPKKSTIRTITTKKSARVRVSIFVSERRSIGRTARRKDASKHI